MNPHYYDGLAALVAPIRAVREPVLNILRIRRNVVQRRIHEGLTDSEYLFPRAKTKTFDNAIARACRKAAMLANLNYGQTSGFYLS